MLHVGRARHPGPVAGKGTQGRLSVEFDHIGGWLTNGDMALDSCAQVLAVAEQRLIPARARSIGHQLRKVGCRSVWAPACQDQISCGHAGVGVISLCVLPTGDGCVVHLFVVCGYQAGTLWLLGPMPWLLRLLVRSRRGGSRLISLSLMSLVSVSGLLRYLRSAC